MLVNYSPLKVAEVFMELEALAPGRIDLGLGRALGTDARTGGALRSVGSEAFPQYFHLLSTWLLDASGKAPIDDAHPLHDIHANPRGRRTGRVRALHLREARVRREMGVGMVFASSSRGRAAAVAAYRRASAPRVPREPWAGTAVVAYAARPPSRLA
jgi:alkanesulfonate monooxygenase SsuD/methylene tetrahydromethanopterin reductase-like flavin-dependent oxidoreductase (luciferase family)